MVYGFTLFITESPPIMGTLCFYIFLVAGYILYGYRPITLMHYVYVYIMEVMHNVPFLGAQGKRVVTTFPIKISQHVIYNF